MDKVNSEKMEVDWVSQPDMEKEEAKTGTEVCSGKDEFSYSLMQAIWMKRELMDGED